jgi:hypothetical protein
MTDVPAGSGFAYEVAIRALDEQLHRVETLDSKAGILIAADGLIVGLLQTPRSSLSEAPSAIAVVVLGAVIGSLLFALISFSVRRYDLVPSPRAVIRFMERNQPWLRWRFLGNLLDAIDTNHDKIETKARWLVAAGAGLFAAAAVMGGYLIYAVLEHGGTV